MTHFLKCLAIGKAVEKEAIDVLSQLGYVFIEQSKGRCKEWDFLMEKDGKQFYFECKYDAYSCKNGDVAIEHTCSNKPSGITTSIADYWIIRACDTMFMIEASILKQLINDKKYYRVARNRRAQMYIFRKSFLLELSTVIKEYE
jgi:Holliday junction resolvase-like predicted endonuclease